MRPSRVNNGDGTVAHLIPVSENPTRVDIAPIIHIGDQDAYGVKQITDMEGNIYTSYPGYSQLYAADLAKGKCFKVLTDDLSKIRTARLIITATDDPANLKVLGLSNYRLVYSGRDFKDGKLEITYDPATEYDWYIYEANGKEVFKATLDGQKITRSSCLLQLGSSSTDLSYVPVHNFSLKDKNGTSNVVVTSKFPDIQIPLNFEFVNEGGNETNRAYLAEMIEYISVNGTKITDKSWAGEDFTVPNGSDLIVKIKPQSYGFWKFNKAYYNGQEVNPANIFPLFVEGEDTTPQIYKVTGTMNNYWRYTLNLPDIDNVSIRVSDILENVTTSPYHGTAGMNPPVLTPSGKNGYKVYDVQVDGQIIPLDADGNYTMTRMDEEITIVPKKYERTIPLQLYCDYGNYSNYYIILDPLGQMTQRKDLAKGLQTLMINPDDLPFELGNEDSYVYVNGELLTEKDENGLLTGLKGLTSSDQVSIFTTKPRTRTIVHKEFPAGVSADIYHNGLKIAGPGNYEVLPGTVVKYVVTSGSNLVLESGSSGSFINAGNDGSYEFTSNYGGTYWLHPANSKVTVTVDADDYSYFRAYIGDYSPKFTSATEEVSLPYTDASDATYSVKFACEKSNRRITSVTASPSDGFSFDEKTLTANGVRNGMKLTVQSEKFDKFYNFKLYTTLPPFFELAPGSDPKWPSYLFQGQPAQINPPVNVELAPHSADEFSMAYPGYFGFTTSETWIEFTADMGQTFEGITELDFPLTMDFKSLAQIATQYGYYARININGVDYDLASLETERETQWGFTETVYIITIEQPQDITGSISIYPDSYGSFRGSRDFYVKGGNVLYRYNNGETKTSGTQAIPVQPGSRLELWLDNGKPFEKCQLEDLFDGYGDTGHITDLKPDENNHYIIEFPALEEFASVDESYYTQSQEFNLNVVLPKMPLTVVSSGEAGNISVGDVTVTGGNGTIQVVESSSSVLKCVGSDYRIVEVLDKSTGVPLDFDIHTGKVSGLAEGMTIEVKTEKYERDKSFRVYFDNAAPTNRSIVLAPGTPYEKTVTLGSSINTPYTVNYNPEDLPVKLNFNYYGYSYPTIIINNEIITHQGNGVYDLPAVFPDNTVMRVYNSTARAKLVDVTFTVDDGLDIAVTQDDVALNDLTSTLRLAAGSLIVFAEKPGNKFDYEILQGSTKLTNPKVALPTTATAFTIRKTYNTITLNTTGDIDLSSMNILDADGNPYTVENGAIKVPTRVKSLTFVPTVEDIYFAEASVSGGSMKFDKDSGELTDLSSGSLSLTTATVEREQEVTIFVETGDELSGAQITLGNGKTIETGVALSGGSQTVKFSEEDLPIIFKLPESYLGDGDTTVDPSKLPVVYVNDQQLEYSEEHGGYIFPTDAFNDPANPPSIKIYAAQPDPVEITYLVEPGITFNAVADKDTENAVTEASTVALLPGTLVEINATATKSDEIIFIEIDGETIMEGKDLNYSFTVGSSFQTIKIMRKKVMLTVKCDTEWNSVRVNGNGFSYPMYAAESELEFPVGTTQITLRSISDNRCVAKVINASTGSELTFDAVTGVVSGVTDKMQISLVMGDFTRDRQLTLYLEETDNDVSPSASVVLSSGKAVEKEIALLTGYQEIMFADSDLPLAVINTAGNAKPLSVYVDGTEISYTEGSGYSFPSQLADNPVVKIFTESQRSVSVEYEVYVPDYVVEITHDRHTVVDHTKRHSVLPGTEITFRFSPKAASRAYTPSRAAGETPSVLVNDEPLSADANGVYTLKVTRQHADTGVHVSLSQGDDSLGIEEILDDATAADVYNLAGRRVLRNAFREDIEKLPSGVYIINGRKVLIGK